MYPYSAFKFSHNSCPRIMQTEGATRPLFNCNFMKYSALDCDSGTAQMTGGSPFYEGGVKCKEKV